MEKYCKDFDLFMDGIADDVLELFYAYAWPGNVRELDSVIGRCMFTAEKDDRLLRKELLPQYLLDKLHAKQCPEDMTGQQGTLRQELLDLEKNMIVSALRKHQGNITKAAAELGILRQNLHYRIRRFAIDVREVTRS